MVFHASCLDSGCGFSGFYNVHPYDYFLGLLRKCHRAIRKRATFLKRGLPPAEISDAERKAIMERYVADNLVGHNSWRAEQKKSGSSRTFGNLVKPH